MKVWARVDEDWKPPPEGGGFHKPKLTLVMSDLEDALVVPKPERPALVVHEGGWR